MDRMTFDKYFENDHGTPSRVDVQQNLTPEEEELYQYLKSNNYRLEQEKIPQDYVVEHNKNGNHTNENHRAIAVFNYSYIFLLMRKKIIT